MNQNCSGSCSAPSVFSAPTIQTPRAVSHFETELARIAGVHDSKMLKSDPAFALASLFGKLPATRAPLLKELKRKTVAKA